MSRVKLSPSLPGATTHSGLLPSALCMHALENNLIQVVPCTFLAPGGTISGDVFVPVIPLTKFFTKLIVSSMHVTNNHSLVGCFLSVVASHSIMV